MIWLEMEYNKLSLNAFDRLRVEAEPELIENKEKQEDYLSELIKTNIPIQHWD